MIVVDASLAVKWFLTEDDSDQALAFLGHAEAEMCAPDILPVEVCRALVAAANSRRIDRTAARDAMTVWLESLEAGALALHPIGWPMLSRAADIALALGHPLADCVYLALAIDLGCELATCDARFRDKATSAYPGVKLLAELLPG